MKFYNYICIQIKSNFKLNIIMKLNLDNNEIKRLYVEERKLIKEIAEIMHCGKTTIQSRLKEMGVETTKKRSGRGIDKLSDYKEQIKQLYLEGKSSNEIGKILGKSGKTISHHLRQMEVEIRPTKKIKQEDIDYSIYDKNIEECDTGEYIKEVVLRYGINVSVFRACSMIIDGLTPVQRRKLYTLQIFM